MTDTMVSEIFDTTFTIPQVDSASLALGAPMRITTGGVVDPVQIGHANTHFAWIDATDIEVDESYQRNLNEKRVNQIARALDQDVFIVLTAPRFINERQHC